jgi:drug/metabolite transporter (DMT)-like permease
MKKGYLLILSTAFISGFAIFINGFGVKVINPYVFTFLKNLSVALFLTGLVFLLKDWKALKKINKKQWGLLILIGLVGGSIPFLLFFKGLSLTTAAKGAFLHKTMFVYVALLAFLFLKEKIDKRFLFGGVLLIIGNLFLLKRMPYSINLGDLLIFLAVLFWAAESIISKYVLKDISGITVAWARMFFGSLFILLFLLFTNQLALLSGLGLAQIGWVVLTGVILSGYVITWYCGLKYVPVSQASVILLLGLPITTSLSLIWTGNAGFQELLAGLFIILGVVSVFSLNRVFKDIKAYARN